MPLAEANNPAAENRCAAAINWHFNSHFPSICRSYFPHADRDQCSCEPCVCRGVGGKSRFAVQSARHCLQCYPAPHQTKIAAPFTNHITLCLAETSVSCWINNASFSSSNAVNLDQLGDTFRVTIHFRSIESKWLGIKFEQRLIGLWMRAKVNHAFVFSAWLVTQLLPLLCVPIRHWDRMEISRWLSGEPYGQGLLGVNSWKSASHGQACDIPTSFSLRFVKTKWWVTCCKIHLRELDQTWKLSWSSAGLAGYLPVSQQGQAGHRAGLAGYEVVNQQGQAGHEAGLAGYELVNQFQFVLVACLKLTSYQLFQNIV